MADPFSWRPLFLVLDLADGFDEPFLPNRLVRRPRIGFASLAHSDDCDDTLKQQNSWWISWKCIRTKQSFKPNQSFFYDFICWIYEYCPSSSLKKGRSWNWVVAWLVLVPVKARETMGKKKDTDRRERDQRWRKEPAKDVVLAVGWFRSALTQADGNTPVHRWRIAFTIWPWPRQRTCFDCRCHK